MTVLGPYALPDGRFLMRSPRLADAAEWSAARLANREWLERAFPAWGDDWAAEQGEVAWAQRCLRLRSAALRGRAMPFVLFLDGRLIGEIGVDAVDAVSRTGEASVWMVRDHGSPAVMYAACVLLLEHAFTGAHALDRLISPVATSSRRGRGPGLSAVGLEIEGTLARRVGTRGMVDHDIWGIHNTAATRADLAATIAGFVPAPSGNAPPSGGAGPRDGAAALGAKAGVVGRLAAREARRGSRRLVRSRPATRPDPVTPDRISLRPLSAAAIVRAGRAGWQRALADRRHAPHGTTAWQVCDGDVSVGTVWTAYDVGTGAFEIVLSAPGVTPAVVRAALTTALEATPPGAHAAVRVPLGTAGVPDDDVLRGLGFTHVATFTGNPEGRGGWPGERRWERPA